MIKAFIIAAVTADGFIAQTTEQSSMGWTSGEDKNRFIELTKRAGVIVVGSSTFKTFKRPLKDRLNIVYSRSSDFEGAQTTTKNPSELLQELEQRGFKEVAICGGTEIYSMFLEAGVVDTIYLTIEPVLFGNGVKLFNRPSFEKLELVSMDRTNSGAIMCEYKVKK